MGFSMTLFWVTRTPFSRCSPNTRFHRALLSSEQRLLRFGRTTSLRQSLHPSPSFRLVEDVLGSHFNKNLHPDVRLVFETSFQMVVQFPKNSTLLPSLSQKNERHLPFQSEFGPA